MQLEEELAVPAPAASTQSDGGRSVVEEHRLDPGDPGDLSDAELVARADERHRHIAAEQRELLRDLCVVDDRKMWQRDGARDLGGWIAARYGYSTWEGRRWATAAHALRRLPRVAKAFTDGVLSLPKTLELSRFAEATTEKKLVSWAKSVSPRAIRRAADRATRPDPEDVKEAHRGRFVRWWRMGQSLALDAQFPIAQGEAIVKSITRLAERIPKLPDEELPDDVVVLDDDRVDQRRADALYMMAARQIGDDADPDRATVVVHVALPADGSEGWAETGTGSVLSPEVAERLRCDARLRFVLTEEEGDALGIGTTSRNIPPWLATELRLRDGGCTFPGCDLAHFVEGHHIERYPHGPTDLHNLGLSCPFHHDLVHIHNWEMRLVDGRIQWFRPDGTLFDPGAGPDPPDPRPPPRD